MKEENQNQYTFCKFYLKDFTVLTLQEHFSGFIQNSSPRLFLFKKRDYTKNNIIAIIVFTIQKIQNDKYILK